MKVLAIMTGPSRYCRQQRVCKNRESCHLACGNSDKTRIPRGTLQTSDYRPTVEFLCSEFEFDETLIKEEL